jgi:hypothetical protein
VLTQKMGLGSTAAHIDHLAQCKSALDAAVGSR